MLNKEKEDIHEIVFITVDSSDILRETACQRARDVLRTYTM